MPGSAIRGVVKRIAGAFDAMAPGALSRPAESAGDFARCLLDSACAALRAAHAPAGDAPLARWQADAALRLVGPPGAEADVLRELTERVLATAAAVRVLRIRANAPAVEQFGPARERAAFAEAVETGEVDDRLPATRAALVASVDAAPDGLSRVQAALRAAVAHLVTTDDAPSLSEILHLDACEIGSLRVRARAAAILSSLHAALRALGVRSPDVVALRSADHAE